MLSQRDLLLRAYLIYLLERVGEAAGMTPTAKQLYRSLLTDELAFLETQSGLVSSINSIDDAVTTSEQLENRYPVVQATVRQIIAGLSLAQLTVIAQNFDRQVTAAQAIFSQNAAVLSADKRATIISWTQQIINKQSLYQQKINEVNAAVADLANSSDATDLDQKFTGVTTKIGEAKQYLSDAIANLGEVANALQYAD